NEPVVAYTDGSCINNGKDNARCGSGVWVADGSPYNHAFRVPGPYQSNQVGEIVAVILTLQSVPHMVPLHIHSDSRYVIEGLTLHLQRWEDDGWIGVANAIFFARAAYLLRRRSAQTTFTWVKGHTGVAGNEHADRLADEGARRTTPDSLDLSIDPAFRLSGAKLSTLTQALAYKGIREARDKPLRRSTVRNIYSIQAAVEASLDQREPIPAVWISCRHRDFPKTVQQFLFRALHKSYKLGSYWAAIPGYEDRARCAACSDPVESMEHILLHCPDSHQTLVWNLARALWPHGDDTWPKMNLGTTLACGLIAPKTRTGTPPPQPSPGPTRLLRILVSESAHLIWVLRCEATIGERVHTATEVTTRWRRRIQDRLTLDRILASRIDRRPTTSNLVRSTWRGTLHNEDELPPSWPKNNEVLVGINSAWPLPTGAA
ncbi:ribonuclease H-like protein, partial [Auriscalpium vulgare]